MNNNTPFYLDKALWVTFLAPLFAIINKKFGIGLDVAEIVGALLPAVTYVVMHKWKTATLDKADKEAEAAVKAAQAEDPAVGIAVKP